MTEKIGLATIHNMDCMEFMAEVPDKHFDLAIVDPPYGIDAANTLSGPRRKSGRGAAMKTEFDKKDWDLNIPDARYFEELKRVSKNQIIWGANYMTRHLDGSMGWIVWDKDNGTTKFSDCLGFELEACELDADYYTAACKRIYQSTAQDRLFA